MVQRSASEGGGRLPALFPEPKSRFCEPLWPGGPVTVAPVMMLNSRIICRR